LHPKASIILREKVFTISLKEGKLIQKIKRLKVKGFPKNMLDVVEVSIDTLEIGKNIRVSEISLPNLEILDAKANSIVSVETSRALREAAAAEAKDAKK
jgi:large subunit ribosomal protein L25